MARWSDAEVKDYYERTLWIGLGIGAGFAFLSRGNKHMVTRVLEAFGYAGASVAVSVGYIKATRD